MQHKFRNSAGTIIEQNISYYNGIASQYGTMVDKNSDKIVRQKVADKFSGVVQNATVLDFGGGTGLDLEWLTTNNNKIFFCEPSNAMRKIAISASKNLSNQNIIFIQESAADFRQWNKQLPFAEKVDAVLANFAVINCIPGIELLFQNLVLLTRPGANIIALILVKNIKKISGTNFYKFLQSTIFNEPLSINIQHQNHQQTVYIYSIKEIIKASRNYFIFCSNERLPDSEFTLIHLIRK
jgi:SAM-dependent methyltransferase